MGVDMLRRTGLLFNVIFLMASVASTAQVVLDEFDGTTGGYKAYGEDNAWDGVNTLTGTSSGQLRCTGVSADASEFGWDETADVPGMRIALKANAGNTMTSIGKVMIADAADHRWMFYFGDPMTGANDEWVTSSSISSNRQAEGTTDGVFDWSQITTYWIQWFDVFDSDTIDLTFDTMSLLTMRPTLTTTASNPVYGNFTVDIAFPGAVTGLEESDFDVVNGTVQALSGSGNAYSIEVVPTVSGTVSITLPAGTVSHSYPESNTLVMTYVLPMTFVHPGIAVSVEDLDHVKARLNVEPWKTGYEDMLDSGLSDLDYVMRGPFAEVGRRTNNGEWENDMEAVHSLARRWYFTGNEAYAQKARDILIAWATTHTLWNDDSGTYLSMGYECMHVFEGADILRGTWPGWTQSDTDIVKAYFETVWWDEFHIAVPGPLRAANQGMAQFTAALGIAIFNDDQEKFDQCLQVFLTDAAAALGSTLPNGQIGDTGRDCHDQGQLMLMVWAAEAFWKQGVDVYSAFDDRMLAAAEYLSRFNLLVDIPFIQAGTVYDIYPEVHFLAGEYANCHIETKMLTMLHGAYLVRNGMRSPYLETYLTCTTQNKDSYCYLKSADTSTAAPPDPVTPPAGVASVTSLNQANMGDCSGGSASYNAPAGTWTVTGQGSSLWYSSEPGYRFAYRPVTGDATIIAQLTSFAGGGDLNARAGLVFSESLNNGDEMGAVAITAPNDNDDLDCFYRGHAASSHRADSHGKPNQARPRIPYWLKIERIGDRVNFFSSPDGASWSCAGSADYDLADTAYFGLAVSADNNSNLATATFTDVRITGGDGGEASEVPPAPYAIYASPGGDQIPLRWLESFEADSYRIWRTTTPGGPYTLITEQPGTSYIDTDILYGTHYYYAVSAVNAVGESLLSAESTFTIPNLTFYEGEDYDAHSGVQTESTSDYFGGLNLSRLDDGDWARYNDITIDTGAVFKARCAVNGAEDRDPIGYIEIRLDSPGGTLVGVIDPIDTGGWQSWATAETTLSPAAVGTHDLYLVFKAQTAGDSPGLNINWFDITYPHITEYDLGMDLTLTYDPATHALINPSSITAWDSTSTHLKLADGSDLSNMDFPGMGITSWATTDFGDDSIVTSWDGANLSGITLYTDGNFGAGDNFTGADFSNIVWGTAISTTDPTRFFSGGSGATSAADKDDAVTFAGADLSLISGDARTVMVNNLGGFDGATPIGAKIDHAFITNSGWDKGALFAAGWQTPFSFADGDLNFDGRVDLLDVAELSAGWQSEQGYTMDDLLHVANDWLAETVPSVNVTLDTFDGSLTSHYVWGGNVWTAPDTLTGTSGSQMRCQDLGVDAGELGFDESPDVPVMSLTLKANAGNTLSYIGQVMIADADNRRWMFYFDDPMTGADDEWVTSLSTSSERHLSEGEPTGVFDWSTIETYWIQWFNAFQPGDVINLTFDEMSLLSI